VFARLDAMEARFESRFDSIDVRLDSLDTRVQTLEAKAYDTKSIWDEHWQGFLISKNAWKTLSESLTSSHWI
jgi:hypothetical protein